MKTAKIKKLDKETVQTTKTVEVVHTVNIPAVIEELNKMRNELVFDTNKLIDQEKCLTSAFERYNNLIDDVISANEELEIEGLVIPEKMDYATVRDDIENPVIEEPEEVK